MTRPNQFQNVDSMQTSKSNRESSNCESIRLILELVWCFGFGFECLNKHTKHANNPNKAITRMNKAYLRGVLNIHKVCEAQIYRWKEILPHSRGETITQISSFTSQRYKVLWGLAKSDNIPLPREVSFNSPLDIYTPPEC